MIPPLPCAPRQGAARLVVLGAILAGGDAAAVPAHLPTVELGVTRWGAPEGLAVPQVNAVAIAPDGFLWAGTRDGLARFDGRSFREQGVPGATPGAPTWIHDLAVDGTGVVWAAVMGREGLIAGQRAWEEVAGTRAMGECRALLAGDGVLWAASGRGLFAVERGVARRLVDAGALGGGALALARGAGGALWIGSTAGVFSWDGARIEAHPHLPAEPARALASTRAGDLWIGTGSGLVRARGGGVERLTAAHGLPAGRVYALHEDRDGTLWAGTRVGLFRWHGAAFEEATGGGGAPGPIWDLAEDAAGNLWAATSGGLVRVRAPLFRRVLDADGPGERVLTALHLDADGGVWVGAAGRGLGYRRGQTWRWWTVADGLCNTSITALWRTRGGALWIGGEPGARSTLCRFDGARFQVPEGGPSAADPVRALFEDREGRVWIGGQRLYVAADDRITEEALPEGAAVERIEEHDGVLWLATRKGVWRRQDRRWVAAPGPPPDYEWFYDLSPDGEGGLFLAGESGFARLSPGGRLTPFTRRSGFTNAEVFGVHGVAGTLWLATRNGPVSVRQEHVRAFERGTAPHIPYRRYGRADGLPADLLMAAATSLMMEDRGGKLWFATAGGLAILDPRQPQGEERPPAAAIDRVLVNGEAQPLDVPLRQPRHHGAVQIDYTAPALSDPEALRFRYRLEPLDRDWVDAGTRRTVQYANLPPGRYRFEVSAAMASTTFAAQTAALELELEPRLHERAPFRFALIIAALAAALALHRWRTARVRALHQVKLAERTRIARELHDTLAQSVNAIAFRLEEARMNEHDLVGDARRLVDTAWRISLETVEEAREAIGQLRSAAPGTEELPAALERLAAAAGAAIPVRVQVVGVPSSVGQAAVRALLRIAGEAITNAARYARASRIDVALEYGDCLELRVADDGTGMPPEAQAPPGHFGIVGMRERAAEIGATLRLDTSPGGGTTVVVSVPREGIG